MEDIFRFMVLRPTEAVDLNISNHVAIKNPQSDFQIQLREHYTLEDGRVKMIESAKEFMASEEFIPGLDHCSSPLKRFDVLLSQEQSLDVNTLDRIISQAFKQDVETLIESPDYIEDRRKIGDSLIALIITQEERIGDSGELARGIRLCGLLERLADQDPALNLESAIENALNQTILLPEDIFPLPPILRTLKISQIQEKEAVQEAEKRAKEVEKAANKLVNLRNALDELITVKTSDFRHVLPEESGQKAKKSQEIDEKKEATVEPQVQSPWILSEDAIRKRISAHTRNEISNLGITLDTTPLPEVIQIIETKIMDVSAQVYKTKESTKIARFGSNLLSIYRSLEEVEVSDTKIQGGS